LRGGVIQLGTRHLLVPGIFDGEHYFELTETSAGVRLAQGELFTGLLVPLLSSMLAGTAKGFAAMNQALKARAEA